MHDWFAVGGIVLKREQDGLGAEAAPKWQKKQKRKNRVREVVGRKMFQILNMQADSHGQYFEFRNLKNLSSQAVGRTKVD